jgi:cAMP phosphodiesterase
MNVTYTTVFSNCGMNTTTGMPTTVYWYVALIKSLMQKRTKILKINNTQATYILANMQNCRQYYITHLHCQSFQFLLFYLNTKKLLVVH